MKEMYENLWNSKYRTRDRQHQSRYDRMTTLLHPSGRVADWGCGHGRISQLLHEDGMEVTPVDIAYNSLDPDISLPLVVGSIDEAILPQEVDFSICMDVMEHLIESQVEDAIKNILSQTFFATYFYIATIKDSKEIDGEIYILHPIVQDANWWSKQLSPHGLLTYERFTPTYYEAILWTS